MAPISPIPRQTHLEINKNRDPKSLPFAVLNLSSLTRITFCEWLQDRYLTRSLPWMPHSIVCLLQSIQSRAQRMISSKFKSYSTNLSTLKKLSSMQSFVAKRSISWWKMFWSWSSMMKPLATWVMWKVRHEQISFFASSICCKLFSHGQGPQEGLRRATNSAILATPPLSWFSLKT